MSAIAGQLGKPLSWRALVSVAILAGSDESYRLGAGDAFTLTLRQEFHLEEVA